MPTTSHSPLISVDAALSHLCAAAAPLGTEEVFLSQLTGRVAARDITAKLTQPPFSASAMDGYAVQFADMDIGARLKVIGEAPAGAPFAGKVEAGQAVRIFTGGVIPSGADHVIIQEDASRDGDIITVTDEQPAARNIRRAGTDFKTGDILVEAGEVFHALSSSVLAAANIDRVMIYKKPIVALFSNGDELREPGAELEYGEIINSNHYGLSALIESWGGQTHYLGCAADSETAIEAMFRKGVKADIITPIGGASVGDYDYVKSAFAKLGAQYILGLPGNPASAIVTASLFLQPLIAALSGRIAERITRRAITASSLPPNGPRETYMRASLDYGTHAQLYVRAAPKQDSSLLRPFLKGHVLIKRAPHAPACEAGDIVDIIYIGTT